MEENVQNAYEADKKKSSKRKKAIIIIAAVVVVAVVLIIIFSSANPNKEVAGIYYQVDESYAGGYVIYNSSYFELTEKGEYIEEGLVGTYKYKSGKVIITIKAFGMTIQKVGSCEKGVITFSEKLTFGSSEITDIYYVKLDEPPKNGQKLDKLPTEK